MSELRPKQILKDIGHQWPNVWQQIKSFRAGKGKDLPDWPDWCYLPIAAGYAIATQGGSPNEQLFDRKLSPAVITAAASWRVSQGVYRFDADLYNSLVSQPMDDKLPCEALKRLPEWCVYIETFHGASFCGDNIIGFWTHLESDANDGRMELRLVLMLHDGTNVPIPIHLGDWTLEEGLRRMQQESDKQTAIHAPGLNLPRINFISDIVPLLQLVLYLCTENVDMPKLPQHPLKRIRMSGQVDAPKELRTWTVGERIGSSIRKYRNELSLSEAREIQNDREPGTHASPRPHVRKAHWHHFWTGSREGERKLILRWLPPIPVNVEENDMPTVIHNVE